MSKFSIAARNHQLFIRAIEEYMEQQLYNPGYYIVGIRYKYDWEKTYEYSTVIMTYYDDGSIGFNLDWWEGEDQMELDSIISIDEIPDDLFSKVEGVKVC